MQSRFRWPLKVLNFRIDFVLLFLTVSDLPRSRIWKGHNGIAGVLYSSQAGMQMVGRAEETEGKYRNRKLKKKYINWFSSNNFTHFVPWLLVCGVLYCTNTFHTFLTKKKSRAWNEYGGKLRIFCLISKSNSKWVLYDQKADERLEA